MFGSKNRSKTKREKEALIASMPVDEDGCVPESYLLERNSLRSKRALIADGRSTAKTVYPSRMPPEQAASWVMNPGRYDVEGIDTRAPANVERKGGKASKPKTPTKPKAPKPKAPAQPSGPIPSKESGVIVSGREIVDTLKIITSISGNNPVAMGYDRYSMGSDARVRISLTRTDGKGLFGLDAGATKDRAIATPAPVKKLSPKAVYKISIEGDELLFRRGPNFSDVEMSVPIVTPDTGVFSVSPAKERFSRYQADEEFDLDGDEISRTAEMMTKLKCEYCTLCLKDGATRLFSDIKPKMRHAWEGKHWIDREVGSPTNEKISSFFTVKSMRTATKETGQYLTKGRYGYEEPLIMEGAYGDYLMTVLVLNVGTER